MTDGWLNWLAEASDEQIAALMKRIPEQEIEQWPYDWKVWGRGSQQAPAGDWRVWLVMAGRGFGKTRLGAEWVRKVAESNPDARIALVGASLHEARSVMVEGESGLLSIGAPWQRPSFESSVRRVVWPNGAQAYLYSAGEPESLRGPQHSHACRPIPKGNDGQRVAHHARHVAERQRARHQQYAAI
ncbi:MAG: hypothetical protein B7X78_08540, partial [Sphingomonadales bacterium 39-62-4]